MMIMVARTMKRKERVISPLVLPSLARDPRVSQKVKVERKKGMTTVVLKLHK
jgi:hypothetical protein